MELSLINLKLAQGGPPTCWTSRSFFLPGFCYETLPWLVGVVLKPQDGLAIGLS